MNRLRLAIFLIVMAFSVTLAIIIGTRLSDQALAVIVGVVAGVAVSIPTSLIIVWFATRSVSARTIREPEPRSESPRIVVVQPSPTPPLPPSLGDSRYYVPPPAPARERRKFTIIGGDETPLD